MCLILDVIRPINTHTFHCESYVRKSTLFRYDCIGFDIKTLMCVQVFDGESRMAILSITAGHAQHFFLHSLVGDDWKTVEFGRGVSKKCIYPQATSLHSSFLSIICD
jgi:hypothetical protein